MRRPPPRRPASGRERRSTATTPTSFADYSGGSQRDLATEDAWAKLTKGPNRGEAEIYIDGDLVATVYLDDADQTYRYVAYTKTWSSVGTHTIRVVAVDTPGHPRVDIDAFGTIR